MKNKITPILLITIISLVIGGCSDIQDSISPAPVLSVHKSGVALPSSPNFHTTLFEENNWGLKACQQCHTVNYTGGTAGISCLTCHTEPQGPEACNTCHGGFSDPSKIAPPRDLHGNTETTFAGVGAHTVHASSNDLSVAISCYECHPSETSGSEEYVYAHIGALPADIQFGDFSKSGLSLPAYDFSANKCSNTYCHGNFEFLKANSTVPESYKNIVYTAAKMQGNNFSPVWNKVDGTQAACGTCHGLPPTGHKAFSVSDCGNCHIGVVNSKGEIMDKGKHINGKVNVFENEY